MSAQTSCSTVEGYWSAGLGVTSLAPQRDSYASCSAVGADLHELLMVASWGPVEGRHGREGRLVVGSRQTTMTFRRSEGGPSSPPPVPVLTMSPVRLGGGDAAGQVIGPS